MIKAFKYRIYPTKKQETLLEEWLRLCCELYNAGLQERTDAYKRAGKSIGYTSEQNQLPAIKEVREDLKVVHSQVLQDALGRLDRSFQDFFRRVREGEKPGYPRYRSRFRYDSFTFPQGGFSIVNGKLVLSKIGHIKIVQHRPTQGTVKTATIKRSPTGKWFVSIVCEFEPKALPLEIEAAGIDAGLKTFATLSTGDTVANPKFFRKEEKELAKVQRKLSKTARKSAVRWTPLSRHQK